MSAFLQLFPLALVSLSLSSPSSLSLVTRSVSARSLARSLLSTVTGDDKMMESMSNAVAILLVTGGAFREPSSGHCSARHFHVTRQLPRDSTTLLSRSFYSNAPAQPLYNTEQAILRLFLLSFLSYFIFFFFLFFSPFPVTLRYTANALDTCQTLRCPRVHFLMRTLYLFTCDDDDEQQLDSSCLFYPHFDVSSSFSYFFFLFSFLCLRAFLFLISHPYIVEIEAVRLAICNIYRYTHKYTILPI